jgi:phage gp46-like protein
MTLPVRLEFDTTSWLGDLAREGGAFLTDDGLDTAVMISLFTHRRAEDGDELPGQDTDRQGWWGDAYPDVPGDQIGSRLWLLRRAKTSQDVLNAAVRYAEEALAWMIEDGAAESVEVTAERVSDIVLALGITITRPEDEASRYQRLWEVKLNGL